MAHYRIEVNHALWIEDYWAEDKETAMKELFGDENGDVRTVVAGETTFLADYDFAVLTLTPVYGNP